jgi:hypothetical protein
MSKKHLHPTVATLHADILSFLQRTGMERTRFGRNAVNDGNFLSRLENGRNPTLTTMDRVRAYLDDQTKAAKPFKRAIK